MNPLVYPTGYVLVLVSLLLTWLNGGWFFNPFL